MQQNSYTFLKLLFISAILNMELIWQFLVISQFILIVNNNISVSSAIKHPSIAYSAGANAQGHGGYILDDVPIHCRARAHTNIHTLHSLWKHKSACMFLDCINPATNIENIQPSCAQTRGNIQRKIACYQLVCIVDSLVITEI